MTPAPSSKRVRIAFETLGCKLNQYETDSLATELAARGHQIVAHGEEAEIRIVNTCTVTNKADRKSRNTLNRARRAAGERGVTILTGCFVDSHRDQLSPSQGIYLVDNAHKNTIPALIDAHLNGEVVDPHELDPNVFGFAPPARIFHTRTSIKVQDGCNSFCSFCIIPFVRGRARSRNPREVWREAREAVRGGARELVLTGVNMSHYATTPQRIGPHTVTDFASLVAMLLAIDGDFRLRISSLEPEALDQPFLDLFRHPKMCPHLHLCLQSGSNGVLHAMNRHYTREEYLLIVSKLRAIDPLFTITTDLIVGFPGESEQEFRDSLHALEQARVCHVHMFPYSIRSGTRAAARTDQISPQEKARRGALVTEAANRRKRLLRERFVGSSVTVLVERIDGGYARGVCQYYHPVQLQLPDGHAVEPNTFVTFPVTHLSEGDDPALCGVVKEQA